MLAGALAQADLANPSMWEQFGPFAIVFVVMSLLGGGIIGWLLKDRTQLKADHDAKLAQVEGQRDEYAREVIESSARVAALLERVGPQMEANTDVLARVLEHLRGSP